MSDIFSPQNTFKAVHATLNEAFAAIPEGRNHAVIVDASASQADGAAASVMFVQRAPDGWNIVLRGAYDKDHGLSSGFATMKSW
jgi:hypothetical protein